MMINESLGTDTVNVRSLQTTDPDSGKQLNIKISKTLQTHRRRSQLTSKHLMDPDITQCYQDLTKNDYQHD